MRCLTRNKQVFYYANFSKKTPVTDEYGNRTGDYELEYSTPVRCYANISAAKGETEQKQFGENLSYDRVIVIDNDVNTGINEYSILWVDQSPAFDTPHDYIVKKVAGSINSTSIAISKVNVSE